MTNASSLDSNFNTEKQKLITFNKLCLHNPSIFLHQKLIYSFVNDKKIKETAFSRACVCIYSL